MNVRPLVHTLMLIVALLLAVAATSAAQSAVGAGPMTSSLSDTEPQSGVLSLGRLKVAPGVTIPEIGWEDNIFDEPDVANPKEDYVATFNPDIAAFTRLRFLQVSAFGGSELSYYRTHRGERYRGYAGRARVDVLLSKLRPFAGAARTRTRTRPNGEIDTRADRLEEELSGGLAYDISPHSAVFAATNKSTIFFEDAINRGVNLAETMTRDYYNYSGGVKTDLTPLLALTLSGTYREDKFRIETIRNSISKDLSATFNIATEAVFSGQVQVSYRDTHFSDPGLRPYRGVVGHGVIVYPFLEIGRFVLTAQRGVEYSFDIAEAYYLENAGSLSYTQRLVGKFDLQAKVARSVFDYSARATEPEHRDTLDTALGNVGYNLPNRTRVSINYEYARRRSPAFSVRNYQRRRVFLSWVLAL